MKRPCLAEPVVDKVEYSLGGSYDKWQRTVKKYVIKLLQEASWPILMLNKSRKDFKTSSAQ